MRTVELAGPFSFTKGCRVMRIQYIPDETSDIEIKLKHPDALYDLSIDPGQERPIKDIDAEKKMIDHMIKLMEENDAPEEQYRRLGIDVTEY